MLQCPAGSSPPVQTGRGELLHITSIISFANIANITSIISFANITNLAHELASYRVQTLLLGPQHSTSRRLPTPRAPCTFKALETVVCPSSSTFSTARSV